MVPGLRAGAAGHFRRPARGVLGVSSAGDGLAPFADARLKRRGGWRAADRLGSPRDWAARGVLRPGPIRDALSGKAIGHPTHPAMVSAPIGCRAGALVADLAGERGAGRLLIAAEAISAVPTASGGISDWADAAEAEPRVGVVHLGANLAATALCAGSWRARSRGRPRFGCRSRSGGAALATAAGWLGGHPACGLGVGVDTNAFGGGPTQWTAVDEKSHQPTVLSLGGGVRCGSVLIGACLDSVDSSQAERVLGNRCSHRGGPLAEGCLVGDCIQCPWHQSEFDTVTGGVRRGPAVVLQPVYEVRHTNGAVLARRDETPSLRLNSVRP